MIEVAFFLVTFFRSCFKVETKDFKDAVRVTIRSLGNRRGSLSDNEIGNTDSGEFGSDGSSDELRVKVKKLEEEMNDLKQLLMLLLPADKKKVVQEHFEKKAKCVLPLNSSKNDSNDKTIVQKDLKEDEVSTYCWTTVLDYNCMFSLKQHKDL
jgi:hypothetical protein